MSTRHLASVWTLPRVFDQLRELSPLRVITVVGPSVFETICEVSSFGVAQGYLNAMTPQYHWHIELDRCRWLVLRDEVHARSNRRVLLLELAEGPESKPFVSIYLHREKGQDFDPTRLACFEAMAREVGPGVALEVPT